MPRPYGLVQQNGEGQYGKPFSYSQGLGDLNCPGDPGCPGYVTPGSVDYQTSLLQEILSNQSDYQMLPNSGYSPNAVLGSWIQNTSMSTWLLVGVGLALVIGMRR